MNKVNRGFIALCAAALAFASVAMPVQAAQEQRANEAGNCVAYVVRPGDWLSRIALRYGTTVAAIMRASGLRSTWIYPGQVLCVATVNAGWAPPPVSNNPWRVAYWNNVSQAGGAVFETRAPFVNFNWGYGSPNPAVVLADGFSARFTRTSFFVGGRWRFTVTSDDGVRLFVNGSKVIDNYDYVGPAKTQTVDVDLGSGSVTLRLDYAERGGVASVALGFTRIGASGGNPLPGFQSGPWIAQFFNNPSLAGDTVFSTNVRAVHFNWGYGSPNPSTIFADGFSARFTIRQSFAAGTYRFVARADDGVRVYVDGALVIDEWRAQSYRTFVSGDVALAAGDHDIRVEYYDNTELAAVQVYWEQR